MRNLLIWLVMSLGVGTAIALVRTLVIWYVVRRFRRQISNLLRRERTGERPIDAGPTR